GGLSIFCQPRKTLGAKTPCELEVDELEQAHIYILKNCDEVLPFLDQDENEDSSTMKSTLRYTFVAPGSIGKGRGRGVGRKSLGEKGYMPTKKLFSQSNDLVNHYIQEIETRKTRGLGQKSYTMSSSQGMETMRKNSLDLEKENMKINIPSPTCTNQVKQYTKEVETSATGIDKRSESTMSSKSARLNTTKSSSQEMQKMDRNPLVSEKDDKQINISLPPSTDQVMKHTETTE
ncbi:hypothetical protein H5410_060219, partial [Solanum commersonii]